MPGNEMNVCAAAALCRIVLAMDLDYSSGYPSKRSEKNIMTAEPNDWKTFADDLAKVGWAIEPETGRIVMEPKVFTELITTLQELKGMILGAVGELNSRLDQVESKTSPNPLEAVRSDWTAGGLVPEGTIIGKDAEFSRGRTMPAWPNRRTEPEVGVVPVMEDDR